MQDGRIKPGQKVLLYGFGAGLVSCGIIMRDVILNAAGQPRSLLFAAVNNSPLEHLLELVPQFLYKSLLHIPLHKTFPQILYIRHRCNPCIRPYRKDPYKVLLQPPFEPLRVTCCESLIICSVKCTSIGTTVAAHPAAAAAEGPCQSSAAGRQA